MSGRSDFGPMRRRQWTAEQRLKILSEAFAPGGCGSQTARQYDCATGQVYTWRQKLCPPGTTPSFAEAVVADYDPAPSPIMLQGRRRSVTKQAHRHFASASQPLVAAILKALR